ncbi:hypothetical protein [Chryseobacterium indologenes]|uniref:Uncharacterized protein n=1 Tax=Chryseobacterium indologenes TaxID=253 RepID=A0A0N0ZVH2_CHRID|nr:hypothetical protein [Chryseobacterium indologenes]KPE48969.1 hypothetical protein AOB46_22535 [Chryseobacterium indologenes]
MVTEGLLLKLHPLQEHYAWYNGEISGEKFGVNTAVGLYLLKISPALGIVYFGIDAFYPGSWTGDKNHPGAIIDVSLMIEANQKIVSGFNIYRGF